MATAANHSRMTGTDTARKAIPAEAMRFNSEVTFGGGKDGSHPISLLARSAKPIQHWFWGTNVHDLSGMEVPERIALDYNHNSDEIIGFADRHEKSNETGLHLHGQLTPFQQGDRASEIIHKCASGVPYQASIFFDPNELVIERVSKGMTTVVNGYELAGPATVFRKSVLRGTAVCPYGADRHTSCDFKFDPTKYAVSVVSGSTEMPEEHEQPGSETELEETEVPVAETPAASATETPAALSAAKRKPASRQSLKLGPDFLSAFGPKGGVWFAEGKSFDEARDLFIGELKSENEALRKQVADLQSKVTALRGEKEPIDGQFEEQPKSDAEKKHAMRVAELTMKTGSESIAKAAAAMVLPT